MSFAYGIICHRLTNPLIFLVNELLKSPKSLVFIHVDQKVNIELIQDSLPKHQNLYFVKERVSVYWGGVSQIQATINLFKIAQKFDYKYFSLLSGDDIPLSLNNERELFFDQKYNEKVEFIGGIPNHNVSDRISLKYTSYFFKKRASRFSRNVKRIQKIYLKLFRSQDLSHLPSLYYGSSWFTITRDAVSFIMSYLENNPNYLKTFEHSFCGDELFFNTIIFNSEFKKHIYGLNDPTINDCVQGMRYIDWTTGPDYPRTLDTSDFGKMKAANLLFARKIDPNMSLDVLREFLYKKEP